MNAAAFNQQGLPRYGMLVGVGALYLFGVCARMVPSGVALALVLMIVATALCHRAFWAALRDTPVFKVFAVFALYVVLRAAWAAWEFPDTADEQIRDARGFLQPWLFLMIGWWFATDPRRIPRILLLALLGFVASMLYHMDWSHAGALLRGERTGFGMGAIPFGLYSATGVLGLMLLAPRFWGPSAARMQFAARLLVWIGLVALLTQGLISSQSRTTWLACLLVFPPLLALGFWKRLRLHPLLSRRRLVVAGTAAAALLTMLVYVNLDTIKDRIGREEATAEAVVTLDLTKIPFTKESSIGVRFHLYEYGFKKWLARPLFGWGPGTTKSLIDQNPIEPLRMWMHLHNTYLEVLVRLGLVGALVLLVGAWYVARGLWRAYRGGDMEFDLFLLLAGVFAMLVIWSATDFRMMHSDWRSYWLLLGGAAYAYALRPSDDGKNAPT